MIKIFFPNDIFDKSKRSEIFPLLKPFLKNESYTDEQRILDYGISDKEFTLVNSLSVADIIILPMSWNYYRQNNLIDKAVNFIKKNSEGKILSFTSGDYGVDVPNYDHLYVLRQNGDKSKLSKNHIGMPVFIDDPLKKHFNENRVIPLDYSKEPVIGFCGQSNYSKVNAIKEYTRVVIRNTLYRFRQSIYLPQQQISTSYLRGSILNLIKKSTKIIDNFIERTKYRAGVTSEADRKKTTQEFYDNIKDSHYVVCVRGGGNFSVRVYEALAMGRIPLFINTDCLVPFRDEKEWKKHVIWIEKDNITDLEKHITEFHSKFTSDTLYEFFKSNRNFWKQNLTMSGYFEKLIKTLD